MSETSSQAVGDVVKLDLVIGDEETSGQNFDESSSEDPPEVLVLRILSTKTRFKFGGLELSVKSPAFEVGKTFSVSLDENNKLAGIDTVSETFDQIKSGDTSRSASRTASPSRSATPASNAGSRRVSLVSSLSLKPARIIVNPADDSDINRGLPLLSARMLIEERLKPHGSSNNVRVKKEAVEEPEIVRYGTPNSDCGRSRGASPCRPEYTMSPSGRTMVSVGVGTTSHPKESIYFDVAKTLRRSKSWRK